MNMFKLPAGTRLSQGEVGADTGHMGRTGLDWVYHYSQ